MDFRKYLDLVKDVRFIKYIMILVVVFVFVYYVFSVSGLFNSSDGCGSVEDELAYASSSLDICRVQTGLLEDDLEDAKDDYISCKNALDTHNLTGQVPTFSGNIELGNVFEWSIFNGTKLWMLLILIPAMIVFQLCRVILQTKMRKKKKNLLWLDVVWIAAILIYLSGLLF